MSLSSVSPLRMTVIGAGTMGRSIATGMLRAGIVTAERLHVTDRVTAAERVVHELGVVVHTDNAAACAESDVVLVCVKPSDVMGVLAELQTRQVLGHRPLIISIAAGVRLATLEQNAGPEIPVVRAMPNTACLIGRGMTVISRGAHATDVHEETGRAIFSTLGRCLTLDEKHLDAVTALSASGPAFIYVALEALADGGVMCGLPRSVATELVAQMTLGAAEMVLATGRHPAALKDDVTTPGGCTIAGLLTLEDGRMRSVLARAVEVTARTAAGLGR